MKLVAPFLCLIFFYLISTGCQSSKDVLDQNSEIAASFKNIPITPIELEIQSKNFARPFGGHFQGIQQLGKKHLIISGSSIKKAYFFIVKLKGLGQIRKKGNIVKMVYINEDFPGMEHNHASGFQVIDHLLAIGTEGGTDSIKSSIVFYDVSKPERPRPIGTRINRQQDTAGAIGITKIDNKFLLAVGGWDSDRIDFYLSNFSSFDAPNFSFSLIKTWHTNIKNTQNWIDENWGTYQSLNFLKGPENELFLAGFYQNSNEDNWADLYEVNLANESSFLLKKINKKRLISIGTTSFKNGAGLIFPNPFNGISLLATDKYWSDEIKVSLW